VAVWQSDEGYNRPWSPPGRPVPDYDILYARSTDGGVTWSEQATLNANAAVDGGDDTRPQLTTDGQGTWIAVWQSDDALDGAIGADVDILYARSTNGGATWSAPAPLNANAADDGEGDSFPQLTTDGEGNWVAVWQSEEPL
jgi:Neuraminidase (sialidase)